MAVDAVSRLVADGTLNEGEGNAFVAKLDAAIASLDRGNVHAACGQLGAVVNQMNALIESERLTFLQALAVHDLTLATLKRLGCD